jgi:membrane protein YdbS with pleckstrin-like domain
MGEAILKPEKELGTIWFTIWVIVFVIGAALSCIPLIVEEPVVFGILIGAWCLLTFPFLAWIFPYHRSLEYTIGDDSMKSKSGVIWKKQTNVPYGKITNIDITQGPLERKYNLGTIHIQTAGAGGAQGALSELTMRGMKEHEKLRDIILERLSKSKA